MRVNDSQCDTVLLFLSFFPYSSLRVAMQPCFIMMLIDRGPSGDVVKNNGEAKKMHGITAYG